MVLEMTNFSECMDELENALLEYSEVFPYDIPTVHRFLPGMYIREVTMPEGSIVTTMTHKTQHPFVVSKGVCDVVDEKGNVRRIRAPYTGITNPGTRRVLAILEETVWTTFHMTDITDPDEWVAKNTFVQNKSITSTARLQCFTRKENRLCPVQ